MGPVKVKLRGPSVRRFIQRELKKKTLAEVHEETGIPIGSLYRLRDDEDGAAFAGMDYMQALYEHITKNTIRLK